MARTRTDAEVRFNKTLVSRPTVSKEKKDYYGMVSESDMDMNVTPPSRSTKPRARGQYMDRHIVYTNVGEGNKRKHELSGETWSEDIIHQQKQQRKSVTTESTLFDKLPDEVILKVFKYLPAHDINNVSCISPQLIKIAKDKALPKHVYLDVWKGDLEFLRLHLMNKAKAHTIGTLTVRCQQSPSKPKHELPSWFYEEVGKITSLEYLIINGALLENNHHNAICRLFKKAPWTIKQRTIDCHIRF